MVATVKPGAAAGTVAVQLTVPVAVPLDTTATGPQIVAAIGVVSNTLTVPVGVTVPLAATTVTVIVCPVYSTDAFTGEVIVVVVLTPAVIVNARVRFELS